MKKSFIISAIVGAFALGLPMASFAETMPFEPVFEAPVFETVPITESLNNAPEPTTISTTKVTPVATADTPVFTSETSAANKPQNENFQNALLQFDGVQTEYRNQLIQCRNEYNDLDNQYKVLKMQRSEKAKQMRAIEKKIKNINSLKEKTRKNMEQ